MPEEAYSLQKRQNNLYQESRPKESKNKKIAMTARLCNKCIRAGAVITILISYITMRSCRSSAALWGLTHGAHRIAVGTTFLGIFRRNLCLGEMQVIGCFRIIRIGRPIIAVKSAMSATGITIAVTSIENRTAAIVLVQQPIHFTAIEYPPRIVCKLVIILLVRRIDFAIRVSRGLRNAVAIMRDSRERICRRHTITYW